MTGSLRHLSSPDSPRRVRCLLAARGGCCVPASHRGGNDPLLLLYRPGSRSLRASDDSERERDGTPHVYCGCYGSIQGQGQKGPRRNYDCSCRRATPHRYKPDRSPLTAVCRQHPYYTNRTPAPRSSPTCRTGVLLFPHLAPGEETAPFYPCTVPEAVTAGHLTTWGESGTEPHSLAYISSTKRERKAKKARAAAIVVSAAAQRQKVAYPGCSLLAVLNRQLSCQKMGSRAAFVAYLPHGSAVVSPLRIGEETNPLLPLYRPGGRDHRASDALGRERDGTPHSYCDWSDCYSD